MIRRIAICILCLFLLCTLTGCWNNNDLSDFYLLSGLGVDITEDGKVMVSAQIIKTSSIKSGGSSSGGSSSGGENNKSFVVISNTADTVFGATQGLHTKVGNRLFLNSAQIIVFGEAMVKSGIQSYVDYILRDPSTEFKTQVIVAKGTTAKEILEQDYDLSKIPGAYLRDTLDTSKLDAFSKKFMLLELAREFEAEGKELSIGTVEKLDNKTTTEGLAVFQKDKLVGWLDKYETRGYMYITNHFKKSVLEVKDPINPNKVMAIELKKLSSKIKLKMDKDNVPEANIKLNFIAYISEQDNPEAEESEYLLAANESLKVKIKEEAQNTIEKCQKEFKSDIFGFGMRVYDKNVKYWHESKEKWNTEIFPNMTVNIEVDGNIVRNGLLINSINENKENAK